MFNIASQHCISFSPNKGNGPPPFCKPTVKKMLETVRSASDIAPPNPSAWEKASAPFSHTPRAPRRLLPHMKCRRLLLSFQHRGCGLRSTMQDHHNFVLVWWSRKLCLRNGNNSKCDSADSWKVERGKSLHMINIWKYVNIFSCTILFFNLWVFFALRIFRGPELQNRVKMEV